MFSKLFSNLNKQDLEELLVSFPPTVRVQITPPGVSDNKMISSFKWFKDKEDLYAVGKVKNFSFVLQQRKSFDFDGYYFNVVESKPIVNILKTPYCREVKVKDYFPLNQ